MSVGTCPSVSLTFCGLLPVPGDRVTASLLSLCPLRIEISLLA
jgi:hypothetical protein